MRIAPVVATTMGLSMSLRNKNPYNKTECEKCGYDDPRALHTHHVRDENRNVIGVAILCANCHYIFHSNGLSKEEFKEIEESASGRWFVYEEMEERYRELLFCLHNVLMERNIELGGRSPTISHNPDGLGIAEILDFSNEYTFKELDLLHDLLFQCESELSYISRKLKNRHVNKEKV